MEAAIFDYAEKIAAALRKTLYYGEPISVFIDKRDRRGGEKNWDWIKKGVPIRLEVGPRDMEVQSAMLSRRDKNSKDKESVSFDLLSSKVLNTLEDIQNSYFTQAKTYRDAHINSQLETLEQLKEFFTPKNNLKPEIHGGFVLAKWCGDPETEKMLDDLKLSIRCLPLKQRGTVGRCILTGKEAVTDVIIAKSY